MWNSCEFLTWYLLKTINCHLQIVKGINQTYSTVVEQRYSVRFGYPGPALAYRFHSRRSIYYQMNVHFTVRVQLRILFGGRPNKDDWIKFWNLLWFVYAGKGDIGYCKFELYWNMTFTVDVGVTSTASVGRLSFRNPRKIIGRSIHWLTRILTFIIFEWLFLSLQVSTVRW